MFNRIVGRIHKTKNVFGELTFRTFRTSFFSFLSYNVLQIIRHHGTYNSLANEMFSKMVMNETIKSFGFNFADL